MNKRVVEMNPNGTAAEYTVFDSKGNLLSQTTQIRTPIGYGPASNNNSTNYS